MIITPCAHGLDEYLIQSEIPRTTGVLHASDIYGDFYQRLRPTKYQFSGPPDPLRLALGLAWERQLEMALARKFKADGEEDFERPESLVSPEGVHFSPDLLLFKERRVRLGEIKLSWHGTRDLPRTSANGLPEWCEKYLSQMMLYGWWLETPYASLMFYSVNGAARRGPEFHRFEIEFTRREMRENYDALMNHARHQRML